jgi:type VI secretion system protein VasJ
MVDHLGLAVEKTPPTDRDHLDEAKEALDRLATSLTEKLGPQTPNLGGLYDALANQNRSGGSESPVIEDESSLPDVSKPVVTPAPIEKSISEKLPDKTVGLEPSRQHHNPEKEADHAWRSISENLRNLSRIKRRIRPADPMAYRLLRAGCWLPIVEPPLYHNHRTRLPSPDTDTILRLKRFHEEKQWDLLLDESENMLPETMFWLDLQRYTAEALAGLGTEYDQARRAVIHETAVLLHRLPEWPDLRFENDLAMADDQTQAWLKSDVAPSPSTFGEAFSTQPHTDDRLRQVMSEAEQYVSQGRLGEAVSVLQAYMHQCDSGRERFLARLSLARFLSALKHDQPSEYQYDALVSIIERQNLETWEPMLCLDVYRDLVRLYQKRLTASINPATKDLTAYDRALSRLSGLDPVAVLDMVDRDGGSS